MPEWIKKYIRKYLYDNVSPYSYSNLLNHLKKNQYYSLDRDRIWAEYLNISQNQLHDMSQEQEFEPGNRLMTVSDSKYKPSKSKDNISYRKLNLTDEQRRLIADQDGPIFGTLYGHPGSVDHPSDILGRFLGHYTISGGVDPQKGSYISYYDRWDLNPLVASKETTNLDQIFNNLIKHKYKNGEDIFEKPLGVKPIEFYDRIYLDDVYGIDSVPQKGEYYGGYIMPSIKEDKRNPDR